MTFLKSLKTLSILVLMPVVSSSFAQNFHQVKDINNSADGNPTNSFNSIDGSTKQQYAVLSNIAYFSATDNSNISKFWRSDGSESGTFLLGDFQAGSITTVGNKIFGTSEGSGGKSLFVSDGTTQGTQSLKSFNTFFVDNLVDINGTLFFSVFDELWKSDGTEEGTTLVKQVSGQFSYISNIASVGGKAFFLNDAMDATGGIYTSDGTTAGTRQVYSCIDGIFKHFAAANKYYFQRWAVGALMVTDGTTIGTYPVAEVDYAFDFVALNNIVYFTGRDEFHGNELWRSDGTVAGTYLLKDIRPGTDSSTPRSKTVVGNHIFFNAFSVTGNRDLWKTDGTSDGTVLVKSFGSESLLFPEALTNINDTLFFSAYTNQYGAEVWKSDGTEAGTVLVKDIFPGTYSSHPNSFTNANNKIFFAATNDLNGRELWISDRTSNNTRLIKDFNRANTSNGISYTPLVPFKGRMYFNAYSPKYSLLRREDHGDLWNTDGTEINTKRITGIETDAVISNTTSTIYASNNRVYFSTLNKQNKVQLWSTDGIKSNLIKNTAETGGIVAGEEYQYNGLDLLSSFCSIGNDTYFFTPQNLWKTNEIDNNTVLIRSGLKGGLTTLGNYVYFNTYENELWKTDGSATGTIKINNAHPQFASFNQGSPIISFNGAVLFKSTDNTLWRTDGTEGGTRLLKETDPSFYNSSSRPKWFFNTVMNNLLYFAAKDGNTGLELWKTDGTAEGTKLVKDINPGIGDGIIGGLITVGNLVYFLANDGVHGTELWKTDGTEEGTLLVKDIVAGNNDPRIVALAKVENKLAFLLIDPITGKYVIWQSNGSSKGTLPVDDTNLAGAVIEDEWDGLVGLNNQLFFVAKTKEYGRELWSGPLPKITPSNYFSIADGNWSNPSTWEGNEVPPDGANVFIRHNVTANINASCNSVTVEAAGNLTINTGVEISIVH